ncbi:MAG: peptidoglycan DD-metalloendopeptidase family protein [Clostridia bacterium]|nr:peptidoglycan DD-metalloendopeptidase family protein [Clostridia bacterium]MBR6634595.1 peptidoglycan DD-metalloendopeptidase family protein [Clostridia bacterium]
MFKRKKIKAILCVLLAVSVVFAPSVNIAAQGLIFDNQGIYEEQLFEGGECELGKFSITAMIAMIKAYPNSYGENLFVTSVILRLIKNALPEVFAAPFLQIFGFQEPFKVYGQANRNYYKIEYFGKTGYILKSQVELMETQQVHMAKSSMNIYAGQSQTLGMKNGLKPTDYKWTSSNSNVATYDPKTQTVKTGNVGTATIIGVNGDKCAYFTVNVVRQWITGFKDWNHNGNTTDATVTAKVVTSVGARRAPEEIENFHTTIPKDTKVIVRGNIGKWLFVKFYENNKEKFAYVTADYLDTGTSDSTKGDRLFYATLGWRFPVENNKTYNYISSPYGPRDHDTVPRHVGIDIVGKERGQIANQPLVSVCDGVVKEVGYSKACGNYVSITTDCIDPVTQNKLVVIYMHLIEPPKITGEKPISKGDPVGNVGDTGKSGGYHLHFDVNNENKKNSNSNEGYAYKHSINPIYFFPTQEIIYKYCSSWEGLYWPGIE